MCVLGAQALSVPDAHDHLETSSPVPRVSPIPLAPRVLCTPDPGTDWVNEYTDTQASLWPLSAALRCLFCHDNGSWASGVPTPRQQRRQAFHPGPCALSLSLPGPANPTSSLSLRLPHLDHHARSRCGLQLLVQAWSAAAPLCFQ